MSDTREKILLTLLNHPRATINDLAAAAGINAISVRHHLSNLQARELICAEEEKHGVGRPRLVYSLSERGMEQFPTSYLKLIHHLLEQISNTLPEATTKGLFDRVADKITAGHLQQVAGMTIEKRLDLVKRILLNEGFIIDWMKHPDHFEIHTVACPYHHVSLAHSEVCAIDQAVLDKILQLPVKRTRCILNGDNQCVYIVPGTPRSDHV